MLAGAAGTAATRRMQADPRTPVSPQPAVPAPRPVPPAPRARSARAAPRRRSAGARVFRAIGIVILIAVLAAIVATAVLVLTDAGQHTDLGESIKGNMMIRSRRSRI